MPQYPLGFSFIFTSSISRYIPHPYFTFTLHSYIYPFVFTLPCSMDFLKIFSNFPGSAKDFFLPLFWTLLDLLWTFLDLFFTFLDLFWTFLDHLWTFLHLLGPSLDLLGSSTSFYPCRPWIPLGNSFRCRYGTTPTLPTQYTPHRLDDFLPFLFRTFWVLKHFSSPRTHTTNKQETPSAWMTTPSAWMTTPSAWMTTCPTHCDNR
jgi:hypothetical protein